MWALLLCAALAEDLEESDVDVPTAAQKPQPAGPDFATSTHTLDIDDDDAGMADFAAEQRKRPPPPDHWHVDPTGKAPLTDAFDVQIAALDAKVVVAELPVLVADGRAAFVAAHPTGIVLVGEISSGGARQVVTVQVAPEAVQETGPTLVFLKAALANPAGTGEVRVVVKSAELATPPGAPRELFARSAGFRR